MAVSRTDGSGRKRNRAAASLDADDGTS
jgi:hypothetical protein